MLWVAKRVLEQPLCDSTPLGSCCQGPPPPPLSWAWTKGLLSCQSFRHGVTDPQMGYVTMAQTGRGLA